jgi:hypothetical protein
MIMATEFPPALVKSHTILRPKERAFGRPDADLVTGGSYSLGRLPARETIAYPASEIDNDHAVLGSSDGERIPTLTAAESPLGSTVPPPIARPAASSSPSPQAQNVLRAHFVREILFALRQIVPHSIQASAAPYANRLLRDLRAMRDNLVNDPCLEVCMALYDAIAFDGRWASVSAKQYEGAATIIERMAKRDQPTNDDVERSIMRMEELGFETTPFALTSTQQKSGASS